MKSSMIITFLGDDQLRRGFSIFTHGLGREQEGAEMKKKSPAVHLLPKSVFFLVVLLNMGKWNMQAEYSNLG